MASAHADCSVSMARPYRPCSAEAFQFICSNYQPKPRLQSSSAQEWVTCFEKKSIGQQYIQKYGDYEPILVPKTSNISGAGLLVTACHGGKQKGKNIPLYEIKRNELFIKDPMPLKTSPSRDKSDDINTCPPPSWSPSLSLGSTSFYCCQTTLFRECIQREQVVSGQRPLLAGDGKGGPSNAGQSSGPRKKMEPISLQTLDPLADDRLMYEGCACKYFQFPRLSGPSIYRPHFCETYVPYSSPSPRDSFYGCGRVEARFGLNSTSRSHR